MQFQCNPVTEIARQASLDQGYRFKTRPEHRTKDNFLSIQSQRLVEVVASEEVSVIQSFHTSPMFICNFLYSKACAQGTSTTEQLRTKVSALHTYKSNFLFFSSKNKWMKAEKENNERDSERL